MGLILSSRSHSSKNNVIPYLGAAPFVNPKICVVQLDCLSRARQDSTSFYQESRIIIIVINIIVNFTTLSTSTKSRKDDKAAVERQAPTLVKPRYLTKISITVKWCDCGAGGTRTNKWNAGIS